MGEEPETSPGLSIVIPAWNEEYRLGPTLDRYLPIFEQRANPFEVLVIIDGVEDRTADIAKTYSDRNVRVVRFPTKLGKGGAIIEGARASKFNHIGFLDADGPILPNDVQTLIDGLEKYDCVIASRRVPGSVILEPEPFFRRLVGGVWGSLVRSILFIPLRDTQCGAKFFNRTALMTVLDSVAVTNWAFDVSLLYHLSLNGRSIHEQPVTWSHSPGSQLVVAKAIPVMLVSLIGLRLMTFAFMRRMPQQWIRRLSRTLGPA